MGTNYWDVSFITWDRRFCNGLLLGTVLIHISSFIELNAKYRTIASTLTIWPVYDVANTKGIFFDKSLKRNKGRINWSPASSLSWSNFLWVSMHLAPRPQHTRAPPSLRAQKAASAELYRLTVMALHSYIDTHFIRIKFQSHYVEHRFNMRGRYLPKY